MEPFERFSPLILTLVGLSVLAVYTLTLHPTVPGGDSGELIIVARHLGVAHPPGYPLFTMLGKLATMVPVGSIAWRVNGLTALFGALAAVVLLRATWKLTGDLGAGLVAGGLFAFSPLAWRYAVGAEVFSLNSLFVALLLSLLIAHEARANDRLVYLYAFVFGLGLTNHQTLLFVGAPIGLFLLYRARSTMLRLPGLARFVVAGLAGLSPYLYLLLSPSRDPLATWGGTSTLSGFAAHVVRRQYGTFRLGASERASRPLESLQAFFTDLPGEMLFVGVLLPLVALAVVVSQRAESTPFSSVVPRVALAALVVYLVLFNTMANLPLDDPLFREIQSRFWIQPNLIVFLLAGVGFGWCSRKLGIAPSASVAVALVAVGVQLGVHWAGADQSDNRAVYEHARRTLEELPQDALLISKGDLPWNSLRYAQLAEGVRPDVRILDVEMLKAPWTAALVAERYPAVRLPAEIYRAPSRARRGSYDLGALIEANVQRLAILSNALDHEGDTSWRGRYTVWPEGDYDRLYETGAVVDVERYAAAAERWIDELPAAEAAAEVGPGTWEAVVRRNRFELGSRLGTQLMNHEITRGDNPRYLRLAGRTLEAAAATGRTLPAPAYLNLGIYYYLEREKDPAVVPLMVQAWRRYLELAPPDSPQTALVRRVLQDPQGAQLRIGAYGSSPNRSP